MKYRHEWTDECTSEAAYRQWFYNLRQDEKNTSERLAAAKRECSDVEEIRETSPLEKGGEEGIRAD